MANKRRPTLIYTLSSYSHFPSFKETEKRIRKHPKAIKLDQHRVPQEMDNLEVEQKTIHKFSFSKTHIVFINHNMPTTTEVIQSKDSPY